MDGTVKNDPKIILDRTERQGEWGRGSYFACGHIATSKLFSPSFVVDAFANNDRIVRRTVPLPPSHMFYYNITNYFSPFFRIYCNIIIFYSLRGSFISSHTIIMSQQQRRLRIYTGVLRVHYNVYRTIRFNINDTYCVRKILLRV